jgi:4-oxalmesaconate hydratase
MIIDCHGHYTTAPKALEAWRNQQIAGIKDPMVKPRASELRISDDELRESIETNQLKLMRGGGAVPYHWGRFRGLAQELKKPLLEDHLLNNLYFDTCVYHQPGIDLLTKVTGQEHPVRQRDDRRGTRHRPRDRPLLRRHQALHRGGRDQPEQCHKVYEGNARRVFPRLDAALKAKGK